MSGTWDDIYDKLRGGMGTSVALPPRIVEELRPQFLDTAAADTAACAFPAQERFANPMGMLQGGIIAAAFDFVFGMLAFLQVQRPCASVTLNLAYIRSLPADGRAFTVEARLRAAMRTMVFLEGTACDADGNVVATAATTMNVPRQEK